MNLGAYQELSEIYKSALGNVIVTKATHTPSNTPVVLKKQICNSLFEANEAIKEAMNQAHLNHSAICKVYECFLTQCEDGKFLSVIVVELMEDDLESEIRRRKVKSEYWSEYDLLFHLKNLSSACAYAQSYNIAHRDIKPQNIFISQGLLKLGDFGSSSQQIAKAPHLTLQGTPFYLSPELKEKYVKGMTGAGNELQYDAYLSDVYSLGVVILYMAFLDMPMWLGNLQALEEKTRDVLYQLANVPYIQNVLFYMLAREPTYRMTFSQISEYCETNLRAMAGQEVMYPSLAIEQTAQVTTNIESEERQFEKCWICLRNIERCWQKGSESELKEFSEKEKLVCSEKCLLLMCRRDYLPLECLYDRNLLASSQSPLLLHCYHGFCNMGCLSRFIMQMYESCPQQVSFRCRICSEVIKEEEVVVFFKIREKMERELFGARRSTERCQGCLTFSQEKILSCGHKVCFQCIKWSRDRVMICPVCGKSNVF